MAIYFSLNLLQTDTMVKQLASLLLPLDALLAHTDFTPHLNASAETVALFRNMWFLCILFHLTTDDSSPGSYMDWQRPALARIAAKTPGIVLEGPQNSIASQLEYNAVIRQEYAQSVGLFFLRLTA